MRGGKLIIFNLGLYIKISYGTLFCETLRALEQALSIFSFKLLMIRKGTISILGHRVKYQSQL